MATGDRYQLVLQQRYGPTSGPLVDNVFAYEQTNGSGTAIELVNTFILNVLPKIADIQHFIMETRFVSAINLDDLSDFYQLADGTVGTISAGDVLPPYASWTFRYVRATRAVKDGRKAVCGVPENFQSAGLPVGAITTALTACALSFGAPLPDAGTGSTWEPRIWRRPGTYNGVVVPAPGQFFPITGVVYSAVSTQSTRKFGRGI